MTELAQALSASLLAFVWQGVVVAAIVAGALALLRHRSANARYLAACCGLALTAILPVVTTSMSLSAPHRTGLALLAGPASPAGAPARSLPVPLDLTQSWTLRIWAAGVLLFGLRLALSYGHVARLRRTSEPADHGILARAAELGARMGVRRPVAVMLSRVADCPSVTGWLRPAILMPVAVFAGLDAEQLEAILAHELAHIRRHDYFVNLLQTVIETLLFYHPAVWWLSARIRREREYCCDDLAVRYTNGAVRYARALTVLERLRIAPALTPAANGGSLLWRVRRLMGEGLETAPSRLPAIAAAVVAALCFAGSVHWARGQSRNTADVLSQAPVYYPESARAKGIEGTVIAEVTLDGEGNVTDARIVSGPAELRKPALASVLDWRFAHAAAGEVRQVPLDFKKDMPGERRKIGVAIPPGSYSVRSQPPLQFDAVPEQPFTVRAQMDETTARLQQLGEAREQLNKAQQALEAKRSTALPGSDQADAQLKAEVQVQVIEAQLANEVLNLKRRLRLDQQSLTPMATTEAQLVESERALESLRSQLADLKQNMGSQHPVVMMKQSQIQAVEREVEALRSGLEAGTVEQGLDRQKSQLAAQLQTLRVVLAQLRETRGPSNPNVEETERQVQAVEQQIEALRSTAESTAVEPGPQLTGHRIARIRILPSEGPSAASRPNLPFALGDTWTGESMAKLESWAKSLSSNPAYRFSVNQSGDIELTITLR